MDKRTRPKAIEQTMNNIKDFRQKLWDMTTEAIDAMIEEFHVNVIIQATDDDLTLFLNPEPSDETQKIKIFKIYKPNNKKWILEIVGGDFETETLIAVIKLVLLFNKLNLQKPSIL